MSLGFRLSDAYVPPDSNPMGYSSPYARMKFILECVDEYPKMTFSSRDISDYIHKRYGIKYPYATVTRVLDRVPNKIKRLSSDVSPVWCRLRK